MGRNVVIYTDHLLPTTCGFVLHQGESLQGSYNAIYAGSRHVEGVEVPPDRRLLINNGTQVGRLREILYKVTRRPPSSFLDQMKSHHPQLIHAHFGVDATLILPSSRRLNVPLVTTFHGYDINLLPEGAHTALLKLYMRRKPELREHGRLYIAVSEFIRRRLLSQGFDDDRIIVHYIGVDCDRFRPDPSIEREPVLLFVGRFSPEKGCDHFIKAAAIAGKQVPGFRAVMIGDGPLLGEMKELARRERVEIDFLGRRPHQEVQEWMRRAKVFCVPSMVADNGDEEAFGLVFIEAQACELPPVSFDVGGVNEAIAHGETGFVAPAGENATLAAHVVELFHNEQLWLKFSKAGRERTMRKFDLQKQSRSLVGIYDSVLSQPTATAA